MPAVSHCTSQKNTNTPMLRHAAHRMPAVQRPPAHHRQQGKDVPAVMQLVLRPELKRQL